MPETKKSLTIYKASAGSGKTFTLSVAYIKLLIVDPTAYRSTLAVTFTNKATGEMKTRILSQLYGIWKRLPSSKGYIKKIKEDLGVTEEFMAQRAGAALKNIVSNYSYFRIETIDSFFQSVLRNLARELDLTANLRIDLHDKEIEHKAVDELIENLETGDEVLLWIMEYIQENIDDDKGWNVFGQIKSFGLNIFKEFYKANSKQLNDIMAEKSFFGKYKALLRSMANEAETAMSNAAANFFDTISQNGYEIDDFKKGASGAAGYFLKIRDGKFDDSILNQTASKAMEEGGADIWVKKDAPSALRRFAEETLVRMIAETEELRKKCWKIYASARITTRNLNQLRLLNAIETRVRRMNAETNSFLLSDTHTLLHSLIRDNDSPFIFEKIGSRLENIMIDEFQDTSTIQWQNFKVLLEECMSHGENNGNLIVGDVKQSIYRWRSGDWRMLNNIEKEFPYMREMLDVRTLGYNYRSKRKVVNFNSAFFKAAAEIEYNKEKSLTENNTTQSRLRPEQLQKAYADVGQKVPEDRDDKGYVRVELMPKASSDEIILKTKEHIDELLDKGAAPSDIAIILRTNNEIRLLADSLSQLLPQIRFVSNEAFKLDSSIDVKIITNAMSCLVDPDDKISLTYLAKAYATKVRSKAADEVNDTLATSDFAEKLLPAEFIDTRMQLLSLPLFELAERLYDIFGLKSIEGEDAYMFKFYDILSDYVANNTADTAAFLKEWNDTLHSTTIASDAVEGIKLITIHQSKGLEFEHVLIPFCDWMVYDKSIMIWSTPKEKPYSALPLVPVELSQKTMKGTIYEADYTEEHLQTTVDHLNMLYVAFTRASSSLIVMGRRRNVAFRTDLVEKAIADMTLDGCTIEGDIKDKKATIVLTYGEIDTAKGKKGENNDNVFTPTVESVESRLESFAQSVEFKQSNKSQEFVDDTDDMQNDYINMGRILHNLFSEIDTVEDVDARIRDLESQGVLDNTSMTADKLRTMLHKRFENKTVAEWFSGKWELFNECTILSVNPDTGKVEERRPDRVMKFGDKIIVVDFKFGAPKAQYIEQVEQYMSLIRGMGYDNVEGYLWFVYTNKIEKVR